MPYLDVSFPAKQPHEQWLICVQATHKLRHLLGLRQHSESIHKNRICVQEIIEYVYTNFLNLCMHVAEHVPGIESIHKD